MKENNVKIVQYKGKSSTLDRLFINGVEACRVKDYKIVKKACELAEITLTFDVKNIEIVEHEEDKKDTPSNVEVNIDGETQVVVRKDGIYFKTGEDTWTMAMSTLNADEIIVGAKKLQKQFEEYKAK